MKIEIPEEIVEEFEDVVGIMVSRLFHNRHEPGNAEKLEMALEVLQQVKVQNCD